MSDFFDKRQIQKNFSAAASNYDDNAVIQHIAAKKLIELAVPFVKWDSVILDVGSGSGLLAQEITNVNWDFEQKNLQLVECDISEAMLQLSATRSLESLNRSFLNADAINLNAKHYDFSNHFDLIISSFALQWIEDLPKLFEIFSAIAKPKAMMILAIPTYESLQELRWASNVTGCNFYFKDLPKISDLRRAYNQSNLKEILLQTDLQYVTHLSAVEALHSLKKIGANYLPKHYVATILNRQQIVEFNNFYLKNFALKRGEAIKDGEVASDVAVSWQVTYLILQKIN